MNAFRGRMAYKELGDSCGGIAAVGLDCQGLNGLSGCLGVMRLEVVVAMSSGFGSNSAAITYYLRFQNDRDGKRNVRQMPHRQPARGLRAHL